MVVLWPALIMSIRMNVFRLDLICLIWIQFSQSNQFNFILMCKKLRCAHNLYCVYWLIFHQFLPCSYTSILLINLSLSSIVENWLVFRYITWAKWHNLYLCEQFFSVFSWNRRGPTFSSAGYWVRFFNKYHIWVLVLISNWYFFRYFIWEIKKYILKCSAVEELCIKIV